MMYKSGINLYSEIFNFFSAEREVILFSAYIKTDIIKALNLNKTLKQIVVRWDIEDLVKGISDLDLYNYCQENQILLFRNTRIHLKVCWNFDSRLILGSANYTNKGLGLANSYNYELSTEKIDISFEDKLYLNKILHESHLIDDSNFNELKSAVETFAKEEVTYPTFSFKEISLNNFLLSQLPMSLSPDDLYDVIANLKAYGELEQNCAAHDAALYKVDLSNNYVTFKSELKATFNNHPFIIALKNQIRQQSTQSLNYGRVVEWIQSNTTTVPTPRRWEIKKDQIVNILYTWICTFDDDFYWEVPGARSEVIFYKDSGRNELKIFIDNLKRDKARGHLAPHQLILLISIYDIYLELKAKSVGFEELWEKFNEVWTFYQNLFNSNNPNIGMPLKVFLDDELIKINQASPIENFRNLSNLRKNITSVIVSEKLISLLNHEYSREYLVSRITN